MATKNTLPILSETADRLDKQSITISTLFTMLGETGFSLLILVAGLLLLLPLPMFLIVPIAIAGLFTAAQLAVGYASFWVPKPLASYRVNGTRMANLLRSVIMPTQTLGILCRPSMPELFTPRNLRLSGLSCFGMAMGLILPVSVIPPVFSAMGLVLTALALLYRDGKMLLIGCALGLSGIAFTLVTLLLVSLVLLFS